MNAPEMFDSLVEPAAVVRSLEGASVDELATIYARAEAAGARAWMLRALAIGVGQERAEYGDAACVELARALGIGKSTAFGLAAIHRLILRPRLKQEGDRARFPLAEKRFYETAVHARRHLRRPALELLEIAEEQRRRDPKYNPRRFKAELMGKAETEPKVARLLRQLANVRRGGLPALDATEWAPILDAAQGVIADMARRLRRSTRAA